ncbi:MAG: hypothetical protein JWP29_3181, partial [Rhodoferax sp.]|nr:hypothetical protein [Rhodoferax sp.]
MGAGTTATRGVGRRTAIITARPTRAGGSAIGGLRPLVRGSVGAGALHAVSTQGAKPRKVDTVQWLAAITVSAYRQPALSLPRPSPPRRLPLFERISALCLAGALAGCAAPAVPPLPDNLPVAWRQPTTASPGALAPDLHSWWKALGDDRLNTLVDQALAQNLSLAQARSRLRQARALAGRDNMQYRPMVSAGARTVQDVSAVDTYFQASLDAVWELGLFGARESAQRAGQARLDAAVAGAEAARVSTVAEVVRSYADLRAAQYQEALVRRMEELDSRALALLDVRRQQRLGAPDESSLAVARLAQTRAQLAEPRLAAAHAAQSLAVLLGQTAPSDEWTAVPTWPAPIPPGLGSLTLSQVPN